MNRFNQSPDFVRKNRSQSPVRSRKSPVRSRNSSNERISKEEMDERFCSEFFQMFRRRSNLMTGEMYFESALNSNSLYNLERWFNSNKDVVEYNLDISFPLISFRGKNKEEINRIIIDIYGLCFTTYLKIRI